MCFLAPLDLHPYTQGMHFGIHNGGKAPCWHAAILSFQSA